MRWWSSLLLSFAFAFASCAVDRSGLSAEEAVREYARMADQEARGLGGAGNKGSVASLADVTNGLAADTDGKEVAFDATRGALAAAPDRATDPLAGTFSAPGEAGGAGSMVDSVFFDSDGDGLPDTSASPAGRPRQSRMLIYRGVLAVEVARAEDAAKAFLVQVEAWGGYLQSQSGTRLSVRLPAEHFDAAFASAKGTGRVLNEQRSANDVTEEFVDLGIRIDNARKSRERLIELLQKADKVEDMLKIENELRRLTEEIERMEGRMKFLRDQVALATLDIEFRSVAEAPPLPPHRRQPSRFSWINRVGASQLMERF